MARRETSVSGDENPDGREHALRVLYLRTTSIADMVCQSSSRGAAVRGHRAGGAAVACDGACYRCLTSPRRRWARSRLGVRRSRPRAGSWAEGVGHALATLPVQPEGSWAHRGWQTPRVASVVERRSMRRALAGGRITGRLHRAHSSKELADARGARHAPDAPVSLPLRR